MNPTNPFSAGLPTVSPTTGIYPKPAGIVQDSPIIPLPYAPSGGYTAPFGANLSLAITGLEETQNLVSNGTILTFNSQESLALQNTLTLLLAIQANNNTSPIPFTQAQLQDMFVTLTAVNNSQNSGAYIVANDLANNDVTFFNANTGFFPDGAQTIVCNDEYMIAEQPGTGHFYWSNNANAADWSILNVGDMEAYSDQPLAVDQMSGLVVVFGIQSIEFFVDGSAAAAGAAFGISGEILAYSSPQQGTTQNYGLTAIFSRAHFMGSIAFLGQQQTGQCHVYMFNGYQPTIISTPDIDTIINSFAVVDDAVAYSWDNNGHSFYQITFPTAGRSFLYDGMTQVWQEIQSGVISEYGRHLTSQAVTFNGVVLAGDCQTGNVYIIDPSNSTDNGFLIGREVVSNHVNIGGNFFNISQLQLDINVGEILGNGSTPPKIDMYYSTDNGNTWRGPFSKTMGTPGQYYKRVVWRRIGRATDFVFKFVVTDQVPFVISRAMAVIGDATKR